MSTALGKPLVELEHATIGFCGDSGDGMQLAGTQFTNTSAMPRQRHQHPARLPRRDPRPGRHPGRRLRLPDPLQQQRHPHPRRPAQRPRRHEPRRPEDQPQGPRAGRHPHRQQGRLRRPATCTRPATPSTRSRTARSRATASSRVPITSSTARPSPTCKLSTARGRPLQELLRPGPGLLALRALAGADAAVDPGQVRQEARRAARPTRRALKAGYNYGETTRGDAGPLPRRQGRRSRRARIARSPATRRRAWAWSPPPQLAGMPLRLRRLPDHAGHRHPAPARRAASTSASRTIQAEDEIAAIGMAIGAAFGGALGVTATSGPGICLKSEAHRPGRHDRVAAGHHRRAARRPQHRPADQDGAGRPVAGDVRPQRRVPRRRSSPRARRPTAST